MKWRWDAGSDSLSTNSPEDVCQGKPPPVALRDPACLCTTGHARSCASRSSACASPARRGGGHYTSAHARLGRADHCPASASHVSGCCQGRRAQAAVSSSRQPVASPLRGSNDRAGQAKCHRALSADAGAPPTVFCLRLSGLAAAPSALKRNQGPLPQQAQEIRGAAVPVQTSTLARCEREPTRPASVSAQQALPLPIRSPCPSRRLVSCEHPEIMCFKVRLAEPS